MSEEKQLQCVVYWPPRNWHMMYVIWGLWRQKGLWKNVGNSWLLNLDVITILGWEMVNILKCLQAFGDNLKSPPRPPSPLSWVCWHCWNIPHQASAGKHFLRQTVSNLTSTQRCKVKKKKHFLENFFQMCTLEMRWSTGKSEELKS